MTPRTKTYLLHGGLFLLTLITTTMAGAEWMFGRLFIPVDGMVTLGWNEFVAGFQFSIPFLAILTVHEFGHYFVARANHVRVTLPYYIPLWLGVGQTIGTLGAFIRIKDYINSRKQYFDIGIAGPLAGFALALVVLWYAFSHLPPPEFIFTIHPEYQKWGLDYGQYAYQGLPPGGSVGLGDNLLFSFFKTYVADPARLPHPNEMIHYPYVLAGYLALFFTSLNLIPIGQLDGGHILYALIGRERFRWVAPALFIVFAFYAGLGAFKPTDFAVPTNEDFYSELGYFALYVFFLFLAFSRISENRMTTWLITLSVVATQLFFSWLRPDWEGYSGFLVFVFVLGRFLGIYHPETELQEPMSATRKVLGWLAVLVFLLCFSPKPFLIS
ncbi:site-2 protease family protein [Spirosoma utsteinense]|uniref:Membrane-associated protease RseP (Regulator of RpoE activity) n=1 Tax=Spirosoma utsteinense TaxID=2585773 RepID=A0ABR6WBI7_9BACT|nr:site-2 protease family protein [Spirosoma utsteinense]MBC3785269.1 membrane-associated protease RseP (regulator of RpoE activity) [Spirosoma utsteinense]MBC3793927.1 membrane-associated protease RseP (regulator of RpoE activity) [Spirosoma utsteinense]